MTELCFAPGLARILMVMVLVAVFTCTGLSSATGFAAAAVAADASCPWSHIITVL